MLFRIWLCGKLIRLVMWLDPKFMLMLNAEVNKQVIQMAKDRL